ncbi:MAG: hypothetical protein LAP38_18390 [Acidobacteriia bacterium]|nr:hypothetical protein [Terriglobia bacterium]
MPYRFVLPLPALAALFALTFTLPASAQPHAQQASPKNVWTPPRTPDGHPDLQGNWNSASLTPLQRPTELGAKAFYTEQEAAAYEKKRVQDLNRDRRDGPKEADLARSYNELFYDRGTRLARTRRTSIVIDPPDGRIPPMTPEARAKFQAIEQKFAEHPADGPEDRPLPDRCLMFSQSGPPMIPGNYNNNYQIVQTPDYLLILAEMGYQVRVIPLDGRPNLPESIREWTGVSRGHWDGDTLLIESTNFRFNDRSRFGVQYDGMTDQNLRITERFTRTGPDSIIYRATIDDPTVYTKPWTMEASLEKTDERIYEYACHEGNYAMPGILQGARAQEQEAAKQKGANR